MVYDTRTNFPIFCPIFFTDFCSFVEPTAAFFLSSFPLCQGPKPILSGHTLTQGRDQDTAQTKVNQGELNRYFYILQIVLFSIDLYWLGGRFDRNLYSWMWAGSHAAVRVPVSASVPGRECLAASAGRDGSDFMVPDVCAERHIAICQGAENAVRRRKRMMGR